MKRRGFFASIIGLLCASWKRPDIRFTRIEHAAEVENRIRQGNQWTAEEIARRRAQGRPTIHIDKLTGMSTDEERIKAYALDAKLELERLPKSAVINGQTVTWDYTESNRMLDQIVKDS